MSIKEIAKRAQVSSATVSRVLNNPDYKCSSPQVRERIRKAAIELNYVPNEAARRLKTGSSSAEEKTCYINILMTRTDSAHVDPFFDEQLRVVETEIHRNNCILSQVWYRAIFSSDKRCRRENIADIIEKMYEQTEGHCDGLIVIGKCNKEALALFRKKYKNVVCVNRNASSGVVDEVVCDGEKIAFMAVEHLIELGHTNIGYIGECHNEARYRGFVFGGNKKMKHFLLQPEYRKWFNEVFTGSFIGFQLHYALFNFGGMLPWGFNNGKMLGIENRQIAHNRYQGNLAGFGISYGYQWIISPQWNLEAGISLGYAHLNYKRYGQSEGAALLEKSSCNYWGPTQAGISIIYFIR